MNKYIVLIIASLCLLSFVAIVSLTRTNSTQILNNKINPQDQPKDTKDKTDKNQDEKKFKLPVYKEEPVLSIDEIKKKYKESKEKNNLNEFEKEFLLEEKFGYIELASKRLVIPAQVCQREIAIEVFSCIREKEHESVLKITTDINMTDVAIRSFLAKPGELPEKYGEKDKSDSSRLIVLVQWKEKDKTVIHRAEDLVIDGQRDTTMPRIGFAYCPRVEIIEDPITHKKTKILTAHISSVLITTWNVLDALLYNPAPEEESKDDDRYGTNSFLLPDIGTNVEIIIRRPTKEEMDEIKKTELELYGKKTKEPEKKDPNK